VTDAEVAFGSDVRQLTVECIEEIHCALTECRNEIQCAFLHWV